MGKRRQSWPGWVHHPTHQVLKDLGVPKSTYYRWLRRQRCQCLEDRPEGSTPAWNRLRAQEEQVVLTAAREMPELSSRQLAVWITDNHGFFVSESTCIASCVEKVW